MPITYVFLIPVVVALGGFLFAGSRARASAAGAVGKLHSLPRYHGQLLALCVILPALILITAWLAIEPVYLNSVIRNALPADMIAATQGRIGLLISQVRQAASGVTFGTPDPAIVAAAETFSVASAWSRFLLPLATLAVSLIAAILVIRKVSLRFRARNAAERIILWVLVVFAVISILVTIGILFSLLFEGLRFFSLVPLTEFLFGLRWDPQIAIRPDQVATAGAFGAVPVFLGTLVIATTAMSVATPVGLFAAIYMAEFASPGVRLVVKPALEVLAGIPTIVYGFFAVLIVSPAIRGWGADIGIYVSPTAAIVPGLVMGIMLVPFISSLADDAIRAVPQSLRDGSLGLGATRGETITSVILPAALPGIVGGILLATSRALGETMIVVMAAGLAANMTLNPLEGVTTVTVQIISLLTGDTAFDNPKTLAAFGLGLTLFLATLALNLVALMIVKKYREQYD